MVPAKMARAVARVEMARRVVWEKPVRPVGARPDLKHSSTRERLPAAWEGRVVWEEPGDSAAPEVRAAWADLAARVETVAREAMAARVWPVQPVVMADRVETAPQADSAARVASEVLVARVGMVPMAVTVAREARGFLLRLR